MPDGPPLPDRPPLPLSFDLDGRSVTVPDDGTSLLEVLREQLAVRSLKDGCSPQGQCGCCTVLVDGQPRVACVTPARRVRGRSITTLDGLPEPERRAWGEAFCATGASQCGFCTPGIVMRLHGLRARGVDAADTPAVEQALLAHLCRCTGWRTILDAWAAYTPASAALPAMPEAEAGAAAAEPEAIGPDQDPVEALAPGGRDPLPQPGAARDLSPRAAAAGRAAAAPGPAGRRRPRDLEAAARRAAIEGRTPQRVAPEVALGRGGFADDTAPDDALVAVPDGRGGWAVAETLAGARAASGKVQGRRTTVQARPPLDLPPGEWDAALRTSWVEPAYLELDASWCVPGGEPTSPLANGGAFGGKTASVVTAAARELADRHGRPVRVVLSREDAVRSGPKRPPIAGGVRADGTGRLRVVRTPGIAEAIGLVAPGIAVEEVEVPGPPTSLDPRGAGWAEASILLAAATHRRGGVDPSPGTAGRHGHRADPGTGGPVTITSPEGAVARAEVRLGPDPVVQVEVACGDPLDDVVLRSYCTGAAHMALGWVCSEGLAVDDDGEVHDLTIRSFGVLRAVDTPRIEVTIAEAHATAEAVGASTGPPVNGSDAVFAAVAAAAWIAQGLPLDWPTGRRLRA
jgi:xanthine dehydrogenase small subunit